MPIGQEALAVIRRGVAQTLFDTQQQQAITNVRLTPEPSAVTVRFDTVLPTFATVELFRMVHGELSLDMEKEHRVGIEVEIFGDAKDRHAIRLGGLEQEHRYWYRVSVPRRSPADLAATGKIRARGEFATFRRDCFVDVTELHIVDDSDTTSAGDLRFAYGLYDASAAGQPRLFEPRFTGELDLSSGESTESPFGAGINVGRAPDKLGVFVDGQDSDTNFWAGPWQGLPIVGMRPPPQMPPKATSFSNIGFDGSDALGLFNLRRGFGRDSLAFDIPSARGALRFIVRGRLITEVSDTLGSRTVPPWKLVTRSRMRLAPDTLPAGMLALDDGGLGFALSSDGALSRQPDGLRGAWQAIEAPAFAAVTIQPLEAGGVLLLGLDAEGRPYLAMLGDPRRELPSWRAIEVSAAAMPTAVAAPCGDVHLLVTDRDGGLWHQRTGAATGALTRVADAVGRQPPVAVLDTAGRLTVAFVDQGGEPHSVSIDDAGRALRLRLSDGELPCPLTLLLLLCPGDDGAVLLLVVLDGAGRIVARPIGPRPAPWEIIGPLDELLEGPLDSHTAAPPHHAGSRSLALSAALA